MVSEKEQALFRLYSNGELPEDMSASYERLARANEVQVPEINPEDKFALDAKAKLFGEIKAAPQDLPSRAGVATAEGLRSAGLTKEFAEPTGQFTTSFMRDPIETVLEAGVQFIPPLRNAKALRAGVDIVASTVGKQLEGVAGLDEEEAVVTSAARSTLEVLGGNVLMKAMTKIVPDEILQKIGFDVQKDLVSDDVMKTLKLSSGQSETIAEAQVNLPTLRERVLPVAQETGGTQFRGEFQVLADRSLKRRLPEQSPLVQKNKQAFNAVRQFLNDELEQLDQKDLLNTSQAAFGLIINRNKSATGEVSRQLQKKGKAVSQSRSASLPFSLLATTFINASTS